MADNGIDTDITNSHFFEQLSKDPLFDIAMENRLIVRLTFVFIDFTCKSWVLLQVCIPLSSDCASAQFSSEFFQVHILRPDKSDEHVYFNMRNDVSMGETQLFRHIFEFFQKIMYENGCFSLKSSEDSEDQSKNFESAIVLMEETYVGNNDQSVRLLGLDCSLLTLKGLVCFLMLFLQRVKFCKIRYRWKIADFTFTKFKIRKIESRNFSPMPRHRKSTDIFAISFWIF